jgi:hypothetical protein
MVSGTAGVVHARMVCVANLRAAGHRQGCMAGAQRDAEPVSGWRKHEADRDEQPHDDPRQQPRSDSAQGAHGHGVWSVPPGRATGDQFGCGIVALTKLGFAARH